MGLGRGCCRRLPICLNCWRKRISGPWLPGWLWFILKTAVMIFIFMWFRWTFPRIRVDQLMSFGWKVLLPIALANIVVTGIGIYVYKMIG